VASVNVELLYVEGCPHSNAARELVERMAAAEGVEPDLRLVQVSSPEEARRLRFLGSPSVRVDGRDVEPGADDLDSFVFACRLYRTGSGLGGTPSEEWVRAAFTPS
jgi:hypothetical protein